MGISRMGRQEARVSGPLHGTTNIHETSHHLCPPMGRRQDNGTTKACWAAASYGPTSPQHHKPVSQADGVGDPACCTPDELGTGQDVAAWPKEVRDWFCLLKLGLGDLRVVNSSLYGLCLGVHLPGGARLKSCPGGFVSP